MRVEIREEVERIVPLDSLERNSKIDVLSWIDSGAELCRLEKPDTPPKHLISYFVVVDGDFILLVDHINAELWLPTGGHVEPGEHPRTTVIREAKEELSIKGEFLCDGPIFLSITETVGKTAGHTDVSLWYILAGDKSVNSVTFYYHGHPGSLATPSPASPLASPAKWSKLILFSFIYGRSGTFTLPLRI